MAVSRRSAAHPRFHSRAAARAEASAPVAAPAAAWAAAAAFGDLAAARLDRCAVTLQPCGSQGNGLVLVAPAVAGDVVLSVPLDCCLVVDYSAGMRLPPGQWPRLQRAVAKDDALPWDVLQGLALLDSLAGGGDAFWDSYANAVLPAPQALTLPLCFPPALLRELQHGAIIAGAQQQQQRLAGLFPGLARSMEEDEGAPTFLQYAFACVRSRAFKLRHECFAFVPFLDLANHSPTNDPSCDFRLSADETCVELVCLTDLAEGDEATISYTGPQGMTNQRMMAQYGFTLPANPADRLQFAALDAAAGSSSSSSSSGSGRGQALLSLDRMQGCMGDGERMATAMSGRDPFAYAALKSLPLAFDESMAAATDVQVALAQRLHAELAAEAGAWPTSLAEDNGTLKGWQQAVGQQRGAGSSGSPDPRLVAAVEYRLRRKALVKTGMGLLGEFVAGPPASQ